MTKEFFYDEVNQIKIGIFLLGFHIKVKQSDTNELYSSIIKKLSLTNDQHTLHRLRYLLTDKLKTPKIHHSPLNSFFYTYTKGKLMEQV